MGNEEHPADRFHHDFDGHGDGPEHDADRHRSLFQVTGPGLDVGDEVLALFIFLLNDPVDTSIDDRGHFSLPATFRVFRADDVEKGREARRD